MPTPADRATASRLASAPPALKTAFAASSTRSRLRTASARGLRGPFPDGFDGLVFNCRIPIVLIFSERPCKAEGPSVYRDCGRVTQVTRGKQTARDPGRGRRGDCRMPGLSEPDRRAARLAKSLAWH